MGRGDDKALFDRTNMIGIDIKANGNLSCRIKCEIGGERYHGLGQGHRCAAVQAATKARASRTRGGRRVPAIGRYLSAFASFSIDFSSRANPSVMHAMIACASALGPLFIATIEDASPFPCTRAFSRTQS